MTKELGKTEARQADHRKMNMWVLVAGVPLAVILLLAAFLI